MNQYRRFFFPWLSCTNPLCLLHLCHDAAGHYGSRQHGKNSLNLQRQKKKKKILQTFSVNSRNSCFTRNLGSFSFCSLKWQSSSRSYSPFGSASGSTETLQTDRQIPGSVLTSSAEVSPGRQRLDTGLVQEVPASGVRVW